MRNNLGPETYNSLCNVSLYYNYIELIQMLIFCVAVWLKAQGNNRLLNSEMKNNKNENLKVDIYE